MNQKNVLFAVLGLAVGAMVVPAANAGTCLMRSKSGACLMYSGSVSCEDLNANGVGNVTKDPKFWACDITPYNDGAVTDTAVPGLVYCGNNGGNIGIGAQAYSVDGFTGYATITRNQVDKNGFASGGQVHASATPDQLAYLTE
jgi:hypothetical protein